jgi:hypothetical protein
MLRASVRQFRKIVVRHGKNESTLWLSEQDAGDSTVSYELPRETKSQTQKPAAEHLRLQKRHANVQDNLLDHQKPENLSGPGGPVW